MVKERFTTILATRNKGGNHSFAFWLEHSFFVCLRLCGYAVCVFVFCSVLFCFALLCFCGFGLRNLVLCGLRFPGFEVCLVVCLLA